MYGKNYVHKAVSEASTELVSGTVTTTGDGGEGEIFRDWNPDLALSSYVYSVILLFVF